MEDDTILSPSIAEFLSSEELVGALDTYDILFLDMWVDRDPDVLRRYRDARSGDARVLPMADLRIGAMSSYVVAPRSMGRMRRLWLNRINTPEPIDVVCDFANRSGEIVAGVTVPFLTGVDRQLGATSDVQNMTKTSQHLFISLRRELFVGD